MKKLDEIEVAKQGVEKSLRVLGLADTLIVIDSYLEELKCDTPCTEDNIEYWQSISVQLNELIGFIGN